MSPVQASSSIPFPAPASSPPSLASAASSTTASNYQTGSTVSPPPPASSTAASSTSSRPAFPAQAVAEPVAPAPVPAVAVAVPGPNSLLHVSSQAGTSSHAGDPRTSIGVLGRSASSSALLSQAQPPNPSRASQGQPSRSSSQRQQSHAASLPSASTERHVAEARAAVVASIGNMLDRELQGRAAVLHENAAAIMRQERDVERATAALRHENDALAAVAGSAARRVKELGNVQNWAELLERDFLVLEETLRLVKEGSSGSDSGDGSFSGSGTVSRERSRGGSREGSVVGDVHAVRDEGAIVKDNLGTFHPDPGSASSHSDKGKGKDLGHPVAMDLDEPSVGGSQPGQTAEEDKAWVSQDIASLDTMLSIQGGAPELQIPGQERPDLSQSSLEAELRNAMDQPLIGTGVATLAVDSW
ncbi:hypothetical protein VTK73DRAFT_5026 [Phialemonium thermophilum]|uniref:Biogenesis of lysosome-related organelles complex 1 subunit 1 n=1 Tax=Phialemonium thermophilum TaxID=223376 RepID=A0ABR3WQA4_9PEZI